MEIAAALARELGVRAEFVQNDWSSLVPTLERGPSTSCSTGWRSPRPGAQRIRLSRPYFVFAERLTVRAGEPRFRTLAELRGHRVGALTSSLAWDLLGQAGAERIPYEGTEEPYRDLLARRLEAVLMDDIIADRYGRLAGLQVAGDLAEGEYAIGLRAGDGGAGGGGGRGARAAAGQRRAAPDPGSLAAGQPPAGPAGRRAAPRATDPAAARRSAPADAGRAADTPAVLAVPAGGGRDPAGVGAGDGAGHRLRAWRWPWRGCLRGWGGGGRWRAAATLYVELFRGTPVLLQLYVLYFGLAPFYPLHPIAAAVIGLGLNYAAYEAEIYRAGLQAVPRGQIEAAEALGMTGPMVVRRVVLPQAFRFSLPGVANDFIALLKDSSLVSVITVVELTKRMSIAAVDSGGWLLPGLLCAALYLAMSYPLSRLARRLERHLGPKGWR